MTREHVWPRWLEAFLGDGLEPHVSAEEGQVLRSWNAKLVSHTVKRVCGACNNGWMAELEARARPTLEPLLQGKAVALSLEDQRVLARWAVKTTTACDLCNPEPAAPQALRRELVGGGDPPEGMVVLLARYAGKRHPLLSGGWTREVPIEVAGRRAAVHMMQLTVSIGPVVLLVLGHGLAGTVDLRPAGWKTDYADVIWPAVAPVYWPPPIALGDDGLRRFARDL